MSSAHTDSQVLGKEQEEQLVVAATCAKTPPPRLCAVWRRWKLVVELPDAGKKPGATAARAAAAGLGPLYVIHGEEKLLALEAADSIRAAARAQGYDDRGANRRKPAF